MAAVSQLINRLGGEIRNIIKSAQEISYYSRGAWSYTEVLNSTQAEREMMVDFINKRLEVAGKSPFPVY